MGSGLELIITDGEHRIDSRIVATGIGIQHDNLMQTIEKYRERLARYGILLFETGKNQGRGRPERYALLNREQFGYLLMFVRVTERVREYREYVYEMFLAREREHSATKDRAINHLWEQRLIAFNRSTAIPDGYWSIFGFVAGHCFMESFRDSQLVESALPDGSIGRLWCQYLRTHDFDMSQIKTYPHRYPDKRGVIPANIYPNAWMGAFWNWFQTVYLREHYPRYRASHSRELPRVGQPETKWLGNKPTGERSQK